ncbi:hypothetical protein FIBSPDRAFT_255541 [Athelia psychrophila]|uniref:Uncharacterized protein n=1 Tax=Athelia psychrophila TaxID=1759441 RepID=A0A165XLI9_9AGAM|nr:hypothetical protein FIBSPDRAFT_255541 [Fibularhizoctonia sp. CBS 109695]
MLTLVDTSVLINRDRVGDFGHRVDDIVLLGKCDDIVRELAKELGWADELEEAWAATADSVESKEPKAEEAASGSGKAEGKGKADQVQEQLQAEVDKMTNRLEKSLAVSGDSVQGKEVPERAEKQAAGVETADNEEPKGTAPENDEPVSTGDIDLEKADSAGAQNAPKARACPKCTCM